MRERGGGMAREGGRAGLREMEGGMASEGGRERPIMSAQSHAPQALQGRVDGVGVWVRERERPMMSARSPTIAAPAPDRLKSILGPTPASTSPSSGSCAQHSALQWIVLNVQWTLHEPCGRQNQYRTGNTVGTQGRSMRYGPVPAVAAVDLRV